MGLQLEFIENVGPVFHNPVTDLFSVQSLELPPPSENVAYTLEAIRIVCEKLRERAIPVLGFGGAPFTLSYYIVEGRSSKSGVKVKTFIHENSEAWELLQEKLVILMADYLVAQVEAGVSAVQIFDSWVGLLSPHMFRRAVLPWLKELFKKLRSKVDVPLIYFSTCTAAILEDIATLDVDVLSVDWRQDLHTVNQVCGGKFVLQGNLDPVLMCGPWSAVERGVRSILEQASTLSRGHVFNLGHGVLPSTVLENVERMVKLVKTSKNCGSP